MLMHARVHEYTINDLMPTPYALAMGPCMCGARPRHWPARGGPQAASPDVFNIPIFSHSSSGSDIANHNSCVSIEVCTNLNLNIWVPSGC